MLSGYSPSDAISDSRLAFMERGAQAAEHARHDVVRGADASVTSHHRTWQICVGIHKPVLK